MTLDDASPLATIGRFFRQFAGACALMVLRFKSSIATLNADGWRRQI